MEKFLKIYVTASDLTAGYRYVRLNGIISVAQASTTEVTVTYNNNPAATDVLTITHDAIAADAHTMRDWFTDSMEEALSQSWQTPAFNALVPLPEAAAGGAVTVTAIAIA